MTRWKPGNLRTHSVDGDIERRTCSEGNNIVELPSSQNIVRKPGPSGTELFIAPERKLIERAEDERGCWSVSEFPLFGPSRTRPEASTKIGLLLLMLNAPLELSVTCDQVYATVYCKP